MGFPRASEGAPGTGTPEPCYSVRSPYASARQGVCAMRVPAGTQGIVRGTPKEPPQQAHPCASA